MLIVPERIAKSRHVMSVCILFLSQDKLGELSTHVGPRVKKHLIHALRTKTYGPRVWKPDVWFLDACPYVLYSKHGTSVFFNSRTDERVQKFSTFVQGKTKYAQARHVS